MKKGYIERIIPENDRRTTLLQITESGQAIMQKMIERYTEISEGMWTGFSEEEMELLIASYQKMIANLDREKK
ncbi:Transcriptional repressor MprA [compost metagenome]